MLPPTDTGPNLRPECTIRLPMRWTSLVGNEAFAREGTQQAIEKAMLVAVRSIDRAST